MIKSTRIKSGKIRGTAAADPRIIVYKGIPYARAPIGEYRWKKPQECPIWEGVKDCIEFAPICMQSIPGLNKENIYTREWNVDSKIPMSEDSLYLNVWTPAINKEEKLPVYVWFHGGAYQWGNTAEMEFDGERIARRGVVVVTVSYRLNVFGFLVHPDMPSTDWNLGNLDQQFAIKWTKENICAFGGDANNIVIGGQSAGGGSVLSQLSCPENKDYIQGAIIESGIWANPFKSDFAISLEEAKQQSLDFFDFLGVKSLDEARKLPADYIRDRNDAFGKFWGTVVDGNFCKGTLYEQIEKAEFLDVPLLMGWTDNEFFAELCGGNKSQIKEEIKRIFKEETKKYYEFFSPKDTMEEMVKRSRFPSIEVACRLLYDALKEQGYKANIYFYEFKGEIPGEDQPGAFHSVDLWFFFETLAKCWRPFVGKHYDLARKMCNQWAYFIKNKNPNGKDLDGSRMSLWNPFDPAKKNIMYYEEDAQEKAKEMTKMQEFMVTYFRRQIINKEGGVKEDEGYNA